MNEAPKFGTSTASLSISEEGLVNGIADTTGTPSDTTNSTIATGTFNITDVDSTNLSVVLTAPSTTLTSHAQSVTWSGDGTSILTATRTDGTTVMTISIDKNGAYTTTLLAPIDHSGAGEDIKTIEVSVKATDNGSLSATGTMIVNIEDDAPIAGNITQSITLPPQDTNITFVLDVSGSMATTDGPNGITRLATMQQSANNLLDGYDNFGDVKVRVVTFSTNAAASGSVWMTVAEAKAAINALSADGGTNYDEALADAISAYSNIGKIDGASNVSYFISDGAPTFGSGITSELAPAGKSPGTPSTNGTGYDQSGNDTGIQSDEQTIWETFLTNNDVKAYAIGIGSGAVSTYLEPIAYDGNTGTQTAPIMVTDLSQLSSALQKTIVPPSVGDLLVGHIITSGQGIGADGGYVKYITANGITYTFNSTAHTITTTGSGTSTATFDNTTDVLTVTTGDKGIFIVDMDTGAYTYQSPATLAATATLSEKIGFALHDNDNDEATGTLTLNVAHATETLLIATQTSINTNTIGLSGEYFGYNDWVSNQNNTVDSNGYLQQAFDGKYGNIDLITDAKGLVNDRNGATVFGTASASASSSTATDATFIAKNLKYGAISGDLGNNTTTLTAGTHVTSGNLATFLGGSATTDAATLNTTSSFGKTSDAIIRFVGEINMTGGNYDFRVTGDDGYQILVDGVAIGQYNGITPTLVSTFNNIAISEGMHNIEIIYWDQGGVAQFQIEAKISGTADTAYLTLGADNFAMFTLDHAPTLTNQQDLVDTGTGTWSIRTGATYTGDATDNYVTGTDGKDVIHGGAGNDVIDGGANKDWLYGDEGNDKLVFDAKDAIIDGGTGTDTLILSSSVNIDFSALANSVVKNIEVIDLNINGNHNITNLTLQDVVDMTDSNNTLTIIGDSADRVTVDSTLTKTSTEVSNGHTFDVYTHTNASDPTVTVKIEQDITHS